MHVHRQQFVRIIINHAEKFVIAQRHNVTDEQETVKIYDEVYVLILHEIKYIQVPELLLPIHLIAQMSDDDNEILIIIFADERAAKVLQKVVLTEKTTIKMGT